MGPRKFLQRIMKKISHAWSTWQEVPDKLYDKFSEISPLFVVQEIPDRDLPKEMKIYKEKNGRKTLKGTKKLLSVMKAKKILLYTPLMAEIDSGSSIDWIWTRYGFFMVSRGGGKCQAWGE